MSDRSRRRDINRVALAFVAAPVAAVGTAVLVLWLPGALGGEHSEGSAAVITVFGVVALPIAGSATVLVGIPLFALLHRRVRRRLATAIIGGALVGASPWLAMEVASRFSEFPKILMAELLCIGAGAVGGLVFWWVAGHHWGRREPSSR